MNLKDILWLSYKDLREKKVRTSLTIIMVMIGVASIVALSSQTAGISQSIQSSLNTLGPTSIILTSTSSTGFTIADTDRLSSLPNVSSVIPILIGSVAITANNQNTSATLIGVSSSYLTNLLGSLNLYQGTIYQDTITPAAIIGYSIAFPSALAGRQNIMAGQAATITLPGRNGLTLSIPISGVLQEYGTSVVPIDSAVIISMQAAQILLHRSSFNMILVKANNVSSVAALSSLITTVYGSNARILTTQELIQATSSIIGSITILLLIIAGISLVVAAIGIMNIMLIAVYERIHEIGIMKSLGFKNRNILGIFLFQAMIIGFVGGTIGIVVGAGASYSLSFIISSATSAGSHTVTSPAAGSAPAESSGNVRVAAGGGNFGFAGSGPSASSSSSFLSYQPVFTFGILIEAMLVAIIVSVLAGIYPAYRASRMEPIDALRQL